MIKSAKIPNVDNMTLSEIEERGLQHLMVAKKKIRRQAGRPRKLPDRQYQFSLSYWYGLIAADYHQLSKIQRVRVALECWKTLIGRMKAIPADPQESKLNADEAMKMLGKLENAQRSDSEREKEAFKLSDTAQEAALALVGAGPVPVRQPDLNASQSSDQTKVDTSGQGSDGENLHA